MRARVSRKWYLVVIVLLYIGLLASFSLNVTLLMRKPILNQVTFPETDGEHSFDKLYSKLDRYKLNLTILDLHESRIFSVSRLSPSHHSA